MKRFDYAWFGFVALFVFAVLILVTSCGYRTETVYMPGERVEVPTPEGSVEDIVAEENAFRASQGSAPLTPGLACNLSTVPTTTTKIAGASKTNVGNYLYLGNFQVPKGSVSAGLPILPPSIRSVFKTWIIVRCTGVLVNTKNDWHSFDLTSDDGSLLSVSGSLIDNDGLHGTQTRSAVRFLKAGVHSFSLDYLQAAGEQSLILNMDGEPLSASILYH